MLRTHHLTYAMTLAAVAGLFAVPARGAGADSLAVAVATPKVSVVLGEPVAVVTTIANHGPDMESVVQCLNLEVGLLQYWIRGPGGEVYRYEPHGEGTIGSVPTALYPSEQISATHLLLWGPDQGYAFPVAGDYSIVATFIDQTHALRSDPLAITVRQPEGVDAQAFPFVFDDDAAEFLLLPSYQFQRGMSLLADLLKDFPESSYAPYAAYALAWRASMPGWFSPQPKVLNPMPARYDDAVAGFQRVVREWPDSVVADDAQYELARTYRDMGDLAAASEALQQFIDRFGAISDRLAEAVKLSEELGWDTGAKPWEGATVRWTSLRDALRADGATVTWLPKSGLARVTRGWLSVEVRPGKPVARLGQRQIPLAAAPRMQGSRLLVPTSFAELLPRLMREGRALQPVPVGEPAIISG